jgi:hypothetical protein
MRLAILRSSSESFNYGRLRSNRGRRLRPRASLPSQVPDLAKRLRVREEGTRLTGGGLALSNTPTLHFLSDARAGAGRPGAAARAVQWAAVSLALAGGARGSNCPDGAPPSPTCCRIFSMMGASSMLAPRRGKSRSSAHLFQFSVGRAVHSSVCSPGTGVSGARARFALWTIVRC